MGALTFNEARATVLREVGARLPHLQVETSPLVSAAGRVIADDAAADRDYPPFHRATRDGFALRAQDLPGTLRVIGEARAGVPFSGTIQSGECVEIMTGAPVPSGADAVIMIEHTTRPDSALMAADRPIESGANIAAAGCEAKLGQTAIPRGTRLDHTHIAWLATTGRSQVPVFARPRVAILATGDEIVDVEAAPLPFQIRNSNSYALAAQITRAGGEPVIHSPVPDDRDETSLRLRQALNSDLILLSGGVSAGKYDFVEPALASLGAVFHFDRVLIQPGQPLVFGHIETSTRCVFFFGLPGNPASTLTTFELFARAAVDLLSGAADSPLPLSLARLTAPFHQKPGLTRFLPAALENGELTPIPWQGSGDVPALCRANAFLVSDPAREHYAPGDLISVLLK